MIQKLDKYGNTSIDNANVVILDKNGNVKKIVAASGTVTSILTASPITGGPITSSGTIGITQATTSTNGYLSSTDWNTFNGKFTLPALTSGSVLFSNGTTIAQDNSNFFWDDTNNRLGIGTNVPTLPLDVNGQARIVGTLNVGNIGTFGNISLKRTSDGSDVGGIRADGAGSQIGGYGYTNNIFLNNGSNGIVFNTTSERMRINSSGNVLINTTTDNGGKLQIKAPGALSTDIALRVRNSADTADLLLINGLGSLLLGTSVNIASSKLTVESTTQGFLPPRMTTTQKNAIATPATGLIVYDLTTNKACCYNGTSWNDLF